MCFNYLIEKDNKQEYLGFNREKDDLVLWLKLVFNHILGLIFLIWDISMV